MIVIGLTGGIGSGKSTVTEFLKNKGYIVIDADKISHDITKKGSPVLDQIRAVFGDDVFETDGELKRKSLAKIVFQSPSKRKALEEMTTKVVLESMEKQLNDLRKTDTYDIIFLDVPLLFETGADKLTDFIWLIDAETDIRINRVMIRDKVQKEQVIERIKCQMPSDIKGELSDEIVNNSNGKESLYNEIERLLNIYGKYDRKKSL